MTLKAPDYTFEGKSMPVLSVSASRNIGGDIHVSIVNCHARDSVKLVCELVGLASANVRGRVLTAEKLDAHNTFNVPDNITPGIFDGASISGNNLLAEIPPRSVVVLRLAN